MAAREERLTPATRNYVIFGLLFVVAVGLAVLDLVDPRQTRGEADSALRVLLVSDAEETPIGALVDVDGFKVSRVEADDAIRYGRDLLDDDEAPSYRAAIAYADEYGHGFVALDLRTPRGPSVGELLDWELEQTPPSSARYAVFSVGDVAVEGPRMRSVGVPESETLVFDPRLAELDSVRLGLYDHPDLLRLWAIEPNATELQARQVLINRKLDDRREGIVADHQRWADITKGWPSPATVPGSVAGRWERVLAAPIPGGLLVEVRRARARVSDYRKLELVVDEVGTLAFVPDAALADDEPDESSARQPCAGLPEQTSGEVAVAPDGKAVVIRQRGQEAELYVFEHEPTQACRARRATLLEVGERPIGRAHASGAMAWNYDGDWVQWWDNTGMHRVRIVGVGSSSGPWWVDAQVLAMLGERPIFAARTETDTEYSIPVDFEPVLVLLATAIAPAEGQLPPGDEELPSVTLGTRELLGEPLPDAQLVDLRPIPDGLVLTTERCPGAALDDPQPCLHRVRVSGALPQLVVEWAAGSRPLGDALTVETLGPIPAHVELAVAADGSRVAWIGRSDRQLWVADLHGPDRLVPRRLDADLLPEQNLRISADGRLVLSEITVELPMHELGNSTVPRAFRLDAAPTDPPVVLLQNALE